MAGEIERRLAEWAKMIVAAPALVEREKVYRESFLAMEDKGWQNFLDLLSNITRLWTAEIYA